MINLMNFLPAGDNISGDKDDGCDENQHCDHQGEHYQAHLIIGVTDMGIKCKLVMTSMVTIMMLVMVLVMVMVMVMVTVTVTVTETYCWFTPDPIHADRGHTSPQSSAIIVIIFIVILL